MLLGEFTFKCFGRTFDVDVDVHHVNSRDQQTQCPETSEDVQFKKVI